MFEVEAGADEKQQIKFVWPYGNILSSGEFPLWSLREGVRHVRFRLMSNVAVVGRGEAKGMATK